MLLFLIVILAVVTVYPLAAQDAMPMPEIEGGEIFATGFNAPQGITVDPDGNVWVVDSGLGGETDVEWMNPETGELTPSKMGDSSVVAKITPDGERTDVAMLPSVFVGTEGLGGARLALLDGELYVTIGQWIVDNGPDRLPLMGSVSRVGMDGTVEEVANTWDFENANNLDGLLMDSHPYGITAGPDGWLWVADAGGNSLYRVDPASGTIEGVVGFEGLPGPFPNPYREGAMESDPVPTAVAFDDMGSVYVAYLTGFPFIPGSAKVVKVTAEGEVSDYAVGLTMLTDLKTGPDGNMYGVQFGLFTEEGPVPNAGAVVRIHEGAGSEIVAAGLPFPTSIAFDDMGNGYVTINGVGAPGSGAVVKFAGLTDAMGEPIPQP
jgi:DNA-binding beta-propeller fold protein YncE